MHITAGPTQGGAGPAPQPGHHTERPWWWDAVVYQVYPRSFLDSDGDGDGDLRGLLSRLDYVSALGVDAIWVTPWFPSPLADGGYDVTDYYGIDPRLGTLEDATALLSEAHARDLRVIIDMVANHTSEQHPWFTAALAAGPGSRERERYLFRDGRGADGAEPPNNWISAFGGSAWTRVVEPDGRPGQWYLHTFAPQQPDVNWRDEAVQAEFDSILRYWLDLGVDGIRVDAAPAFVKEEGLPDADYGAVPRFVATEWVDNPHWDVDGVHDVLRRWRTIGDAYPGDRLFVAEAVVNGPERLSRYVRPGEMQTTFNFPFLKAPWGPELRQVIDDTLAALAPVGAPATWVLASHDETRLVTRYGRRRTSAVHAELDEGEPWDLALGTRRARAAALLLLALPGGAYVYQGEELGLPEVQDIPEDRLQDPLWERSGRTVRGRDGCRVPLPWSGTEPPFGFSPPGTTTWLPQPATWASLTVEAQERDPASMLALYRAALRIRREVPALRSSTLRWLPSAPDVLDLDRGGVRCVVNLTGAPLRVDPESQVLLSSAPLADGMMAPDAAAWLVERPASPPPS